jgi:hypothetical protein
MGPCHRARPGYEASQHLISLLKQKELDAFIVEGLCTGRIHPSKAPMVSPVFFVKKKDGALQFV